VFVLVRERARKKDRYVVLDRVHSSASGARQRPVVTYERPLAARADERDAHDVGLSGIYGFASGHRRRVRRSP
jgi:hypothetical protein